MKKVLMLAAVAASVSCFVSGSAVLAQDLAPNDNLNAALWTQRSVEFKGNALTVFALGKIRLDQALADKKLTAAPVEQTGDYANLPPAVVLDVDETVLDNSAYQVWNIKAGTSFSTKTWNEFCDAKISTAVPGAVEFTRYAESKGVKVFYVTNRDVAVEKSTRENIAGIIDSHPETAVALISHGRETTYGQLRRQVAALRAEFTRLGVQRGECVALLCSNTPYFVVSYLATVGIGAVAAPLNPTSPAPEIEKELAVVQPAVVVIEPAAMATWSGITADTRRAAPTPTIAPVMVWVVETGMPSAVAKNKVRAPPVSAQKPPTGLSLVMR